jgi:hypothetical protein
MIPYLSQIKMALMAGAALALVVGTAYVTHRFDAGKLEQFKAAQYKQAAEDNAKALLQQTAHDAAVHDAIDTLNKVSSERDEQSLKLKKVINSAPKTRACVDSPAIHSLIDGLRGAGTAHGH